ncbi:putative CRISPR-associated protein [Aphanizomenon flos-aquae NRERC-008]|jgi:putative CRISPR-associated protein (TIGR02619 family)|uniref:CRISPR-associated protein n=1 Tax=Aphanizomenon flos-aquae FACHB-1249 TaxID=2692889 RepID=A0ABR8IRW8_APHFL|nr:MULTISPECIES: putative CRISPR-associated protein [Aphanizomenon]MCE2905287.1 putative CRISPR-associated protein [Anabaena sp. CoA2_C59]MDJ0506054.1 putative CRISPR-associated protein [Nostocales cyanobacterium LE14-WE12]MBD2389276.1 putative CRISPR-associated protein [Aphanizomenon flos-aquae FACHB-1171]MBD2555349.1 putative CRISPR-associated protein [Aphanizomenon flos-aquae FACHB-1290]MBD2631522.1 putative CRISPR-associated protein [Aphanizomenon sp. FACHB-1399]
METMIMTVGTSLLTNRDDNSEKKRPWVGQKNIGDRQIAIQWMSEIEPEFISAETNTIWRLNPNFNDEILLLHSDTPSGLECAEVLKEYLENIRGQKNVSLNPIPGINYDLDESGSALEQMAIFLKKLVLESKGNVTLAATGGFKAQTMIMAVIGNAFKIPICYVHEQYKALIYLPYLSDTAEPQVLIKPANLPESGLDRSQIIKVQNDSYGHHRPKTWKKVEKMLQDIPWVEYVRFDKNAFSAPKNGMKAATRKTGDGRHIFWIHLYENEEKKIAVSVETTGYKPEHLEQATKELRERLGRLI